MGASRAALPATAPTPRTAVKLTSGWRMVVAGSRHFSSGGSGCASVSFPVDPQIAVAPGDLHLDFREIKFGSAGNNCASRGQFKSAVSQLVSATGGLAGTGRISSRNGNLSCPQSITTQSPVRLNPNKFGGSCFFNSQFPDLSWVIPIPVQFCKSAARFLLQRSRALFAQPDGQRVFRRAVGGVADFKNPFRLQQIIQQRTQLRRAVARAGREFRFEPRARRARKFVERLRFPALCASAEQNSFVNAKWFGSAEI